MYFTGNLEVAYRANVWSRTASRILLPIAEFETRSKADIYENLARLPWEDHVPAAGTIAVDFAMSQARPAGRKDASPVVRNTMYGAQIVKDIICDRLRRTKGDRPTVTKYRPDVLVSLSIDHEQRSTLAIDLSGDPLFKRGYRVADSAGHAPLKENLAAGMLLLCGWKEMAASGGFLVDPMCGSGTTAIEAALIQADLPPNLTREYFGFLGWFGHDPAAWNRVRQGSTQQSVASDGDGRIIASDWDAKCVQAAAANTSRAGVGRRIALSHRILADLQRPGGSTSSGLIFVNPPYGERMGADQLDAMHRLYSQVGDVMKRSFSGWKGAVLTGNADLAKSIGLRSSRRLSLYNGPIECRLIEFDLLATAAEPASRPSP